MQLIKKRPIALPVLKSGRWYDDFAVTGANNSGYSLASGTKTKISDGIRLSASGGGTTYSLNLPTYYRAKNFESELVMRHVAGNDMRFVFRYVNAQNYWYIFINGSNNNLRLQKVVANVFTNAAIYVTGNVGKFNRYGIRAAGSRIEVYFEGQKVASVSDTDNINGENFQLVGYNATPNTATGDYQYLAIKPL